MAGYTSEGFTWVIESTAPDATTVRTTIESDGVNPPSITVAMQTLGSDKWLSGDWLAPKVTMDPPWPEPAQCAQCPCCGEAGYDDPADCSVCADEGHNHGDSADHADPAEAAWHERTRHDRP